MKERYFLAHITTSKIAERILATKEFKKSIHTDSTIQWLGDGVYFWDNNDKSINDLGKRLVKYKPENHKEQISKIEIIVEVDENNHLNLDDNNTAKAFEDFLELTRDKYLLNLLKMYKSKTRLTQYEKNKLGKLFGTCINAFQNYLEQNEGYITDLVSYTFYSGTQRKILFSKEELNNRQFCIKKLDLINNLDDKNYFCSII